MKCPNNGRISYIHFVWQSCKLKDIDKHIILRNWIIFDVKHCKPFEKPWGAIIRKQGKWVKKSQSCNTCRVVGLGNLMRGKIYYLIIRIKILKNIQSRNGKLIPDAVNYDELIMLLIHRRTQMAKILSFENNINSVLNRFM